jgi:hypothetical protein
VTACSITTITGVPVSKKPGAVQIRYAGDLGSAERNPTGTSVEGSMTQKPPQPGAQVLAGSFNSAWCLRSGLVVDPVPDLALGHGAGDQSSVSLISGYPELQSVSQDQMASSWPTPRAKSPASTNSR